MSSTEHWFDPLPPNSTNPVDIDGTPVLICNSGGTHYAIEDRCTHQDTPLHKGRLRGQYISCPLHGVRFDLTTGEPKGTLTRIPVRTFEVVEEDGRIGIRL